MQKKNNSKKDNKARFEDNQKPAINIPLENLVNSDGLDYAHYVLQNRALVEVYGDGMKPVQRRILYGMYKMGSTPTNKTIKGARVAGEIIGKYHPHGNCLSADTSFLLQDGTKRTIESLWKEQTEKETSVFEGYSIDKNGEIVPSNIEHIRIGQYSDKICNIKLSNGSVIKCTEEHPFRLFNGEYCIAKDLAQGDMLSTYDFSEHDNGVKNKAEGLSVVGIEIDVLKEKIPMYDFTVNELENSLFFAGNDKLICLHNSSVEDAQENMGQAFNTRIPMFRIQGTLGNFASDEAPSARYYEIGLNKQSWELVLETSDKCTPMTITDIGEEYEPIQLPTKFPYLLIQGSSGIAVGYASNIPSHNPDECMNACIAYYKNKLKNTQDILKYMKGPDFPTGGVLLGVDGIQEYFETGSGTFTVRGKYRVEELSRGRTLVDFYELPYQVSVSQVIEAVYKAQEKGFLKEISEVKDLSDGEVGLKCAIYVKSGSNINKVIEDIFKYTPAQSKFSVNATALIKGKPTSNIPMLEMIKGWCSFRQECFIRKTQYRSSQIEAELHKYNGLLAILVDIDQAISIIRDAKDTQEANRKLQSAFKIDEEQANSILALQLRKLTKADKQEIIAKSNELKEEHKKLQSILQDETLLRQEIIKELEETKKIIHSERRTEILNITNTEIEQYAKEQARNERMLGKDIECFIHITKDNKVYKDLKVNSEQEYSFKTTSLADSYLVFRDGDLIAVKNEDIPLGQDNAIDLSMLNKSVHQKKVIVGMIPSSDKCQGILVISDKGDGNIIKSPYKDGRSLVTLIPGDILIKALPIYGQEESVIILDESAQMVKVGLSKIRQTRQGAGLIKLGSLEHKIVDCLLVHSKGVLTTVGNTNTIRSVLVEDCPDKGRGGRGYKLHRLHKNEKVQEVYFQNEYTDQKTIARGL